MKRYGDTCVYTEVMLLEVLLYDIVGVDFFPVLRRSLSIDCIDIVLFEVELMKDLGVKVWLYTLPVLYCPRAMQFYEINKTHIHANLPCLILIEIRSIILRSHECDQIWKSPVWLTLIFLPENASTR